MNRKLAKIGIAGVAALALVGVGGTYAAFTDAEDVSAVEVGAGTLNLGLGQPAFKDSSADMKRLAPGQTVRMAFAVTNATNAANSVKVPGTVTVNLDSITNSNATFPFDAVGKVAIFSWRSGSADCAGDGLPESYGGSATSGWSPAGGWALVKDATAPVTLKEGSAALVVAPGETVCVGAVIGLPSTAGNEYQGSYSAFKYKVTLEQKTA